MNLFSRLFSLAAMVALLVASSALSAGDLEGYQYNHSYPWMQSQESAKSSSGGAGGGFKLAVDAGTADNEINGFIRIDEQTVGPATIGTEADFDNNFGFESEDATRIGAKLQAGFFSLEVASQDVSFTSNNLSGTITIFGSVIDVNAPADSTLDMPYYQVKLGFELNSADPANDDWLAFGFGIGVHYFDFSFELNATEDITNTVINESEEFPAPLPTLGLMLGIHPSESISIEATFWALVVPEIEGVEGSIFDANVVVKYYVIENIAIGARVGMVMLDVDANVEEDDDTIIGEIQIDSLQLSALVGISF